MRLEEKIIPLYIPLFESLLPLELPDESIATCESCTQCRSPQSPYINTKCCAYHPHLANYLVGGILQNTHSGLETGKSRVDSQIKLRFGVTPYGIIPPYPFFNRVKEFKSHEFWLRPKELNEQQLCPYYSNGLCSIWPYRENLCSTYFCSSVGGKAGKKFWDAVNQYIKLTETTLAQYALLQIGWSPEEIKTNYVTTTDFNFEDEEGHLDDGKYQQLWGKWAGREREFFINCYEVVKDLDIETFRRLTGLKGEILEKAIRNRHRTFNENVIPELLVLNQNVVIRDLGNSKSRLVLGDDSVEIPSVLAPLIKGFNRKRTTTEAFRLGFDVLFNMSDLVDELLDKGILVKG